MQKRRQTFGGGVALLAFLLPLGCSESTGPQTLSSGSSLQSVVSIVSQDRAQLLVAGVTTEATKGVFSIGWKKFVGPNIAEGGTIGEAYAVVQSESTTTTIRPSGIDIGTVTLSFTGGSVELTKRVTPNGGVLYETFSKGFHQISTLPVNIPFVANAVYTFDVSGSSNYSPGNFQITAPSSLLSISGHADGDTVSVASDLKLQWTGGSTSDSVLVRIVPHLRPAEIEACEGRDSMMAYGDHNGGQRPMGHREGHFMVGGPLEGLGPEFMRGIIVMAPNTGSYTVSAADLGTLLNGTGAGELMIGITQKVKQDIVHDGGTTTVILRNGDRVVLHVR